MKVKNVEHNHEASFGPVAHPIHRRLPTEVKDQVRGLTASGTAARIVVSTMRMESQQTIIAKDVYNIRAKIRKENLAGKTPIESLIAILKESDYVFNYRTDNICRITHLFFAHPKSIELFNRYPHVLLLDCTYKTNKFKLPLLNVVGITCLNTTFHVAFCFMADEEEKSYVWALEQLQGLLKEGIKSNVMVTDRELALINTIRVVFK